MNYPRHIAIVPDGNRTRAKERGLPSIVWHKMGFENAKKIIKYFFSQTPIEIATMRWASTENIQERSPQELEYLYKIYQIITDDMVQLHKDYGLGFKWIGSEIGLPSSLIKFFYKQQERYPSKDGKYLILAVNYGGNDEIVRGINSFLSSHPWVSEITSQELSSHMDLWNIPPIDLVIRTKGKMAKRLSGFMTWRISYAELYFSEKYFPDFTIDELQKTLERYDSIVSYRNFGK